MPVTINRPISLPYKIMCRQMPVDAGNNYIALSFKIRCWHIILKERVRGLLPARYFERKGKGSNDDYHHLPAHYFERMKIILLMVTGIYRHLLAHYFERKRKNSIDTTKSKLLV